MVKRVPNHASNYISRSLDVHVWSHNSLMNIFYSLKIHDTMGLHRHAALKVKGAHHPLLLFFEWMWLHAWTHHDCAHVFAWMDLLVRLLCFLRAHRWQSLHPAMALVAVEQSDGSVHVQAPLKFKLGAPWLLGAPWPHVPLAKQCSRFTTCHSMQSPRPTFGDNPGCWHADCQGLENVPGPTETASLGRPRHWHAHSPNMP